MVNWLRGRGKTLKAGEFVSTGTCTGHFFSAPGDHLIADFGEIGQVSAFFE
jgi:2-keto-4-pentenoate hydratase